MASSHKFASSDVVSMFPTLVWKLALGRGACASLNTEILGAIADLRGTGLPLAPGESWQSPPGLHHRLRLGSLFDAVHAAVHGVLAFLRIGADGLVITGSWATVNAPGAAHTMHTHPNNYLSGVYYVQVEPGADTINFHDPRPQTAIMRAPVTELTSANTDQVVVSVRAGALLLFPSWLAHSVDANASSRERVSVSFNLMFPEFAEHLAKPLWGGEET